MSGKDLLTSTPETPMALALSDASSEKVRDSPTLFTIAQDFTQTDPHTTTNESLTTFEDVPLDSAEDTQVQPLEFQYSFHKNNVALHNQVISQKVFSQITKKFQEDQKANPPAKRRKKQVCVQYKKTTESAATPIGTQKSLSEELGQIVLGTSQKTEDRKSLTCHNPIAIIQDLDPESQLNFNLTIPLKTASHELEELKLENLELKQQLKQQQILFETKKYSLKCQKETLVQEIAKYNTRVQLLEQENAQLAKFDVVSTKNAKISTSPSHFANFFKEQSIQAETTTKAASAQTEDEFNPQRIEKLKDQIKTHLAIIAKYEKERTRHRGIIEKQQQMLTLCENEKTEAENKKLTVMAELQTVKLEHERHKKSTVNLLNELKAKVSNLETENKVLSEENGRLKEEIAIIDEQPETLREMTEKLSHYQELYAQYEQNAKDQKKLAEEYKQKLDEAIKNTEGYKSESHKQAEKIRELKKERDQLRIDNLKQRQLFTEKCESYKEIRAALRRKLKQKDDLLLRLQKEIDSIQTNKRDASQQDISCIEPEGVEEKIFPRPKSLESTGKHALKDLTTTLQLEELSAELKKKLEGVLEANARIAKVASERTPGDAKKKATKKRVIGAYNNNEKTNATDKSKSFYSDDAGIDGKNEEPPNGSNSKDALEEKVKELKMRKITPGKLLQEGITKRRESSSIHSDSQSEYSNQSMHQLEPFPYSKVNFVVNPHHLHARLKNQPTDGDTNKNLKFKLTPKIFNGNRDFTPPLFRPEDKKSRVSPKLMIEAPTREKPSTRPEKLVSPRKPTEPVLEPMAPLNANVVTGHYTPSQDYQITTNYKGEVRSASANRKTIEGKQNIVVTKAKVANVKGIHGGHPRNYIAKHPTAANNARGIGSSNSKGIKR